jgi:hypothetical protein
MPRNDGGRRAFCLASEGPQLMMEKRTAEEVAANSFALRQSAKTMPV